MQEFILSQKFGNQTMKLLTVISIYIATLLTIDAAWNFYQDFPSVFGFVDHTCKTNTTDDGAAPKTKWSAEL